MKEHTFDIARFIFELSEIPASDPLVNLNTSKPDVIGFPEGFNAVHSFPMDGSWSRILKTATLNKRESDLDSLCLVKDTITWNYKDSTVTSPLVLIPVSWKINKVKQVVEVTPDMENCFLNPFVKNQFVRAFELNPAEIGDNLSDWSSDFQLLIAEKELPVQIAEWNGAGNFHHHRYQVLRELELIQQAEHRSSLLETILGNEVPEETQQLVISPELLSPADTDQLAVFKTLESGNVVIQGPPGTGKSQVLTNLLGKLMAGDGMTLVVSEKKVALEVLVKKLAEFGLDAFTFTAHSQSAPRDFISRLKSTWSALEEDRPPVPNSLLLSEQLKAQLQLLMDRLNSPLLMGGVSFSVFQELVQASPIETAVFRSDVPSVAEWLEIRPKLTELEQHLGSFEAISNYKQALFSTLQFDIIIRKLATETAFVQAAFSIQTIGELEALYKSAARCQLIANESFRSYFELHGKPKELRKFHKLRLQYTELIARQNLLYAETTNWKTAPSRSQAESWKQQLTEKQSWFTKRKSRKLLQPFLADPSLNPLLALNNWLDWLTIRETVIELESQFAAWGISRPELELESAVYVLNQLEQEDPNELNKVARLSSGERKKILESGDRLKQLIQDLHRYLKIEETGNLSALFVDADQLITRLLPQAAILKSLPEPVFRLLVEGKNVQGIQAIVLHSNWLLLEAQFPELAKFTGDSLTLLLNRITETEQEEYSLFAHALWQRRKTKFEQYATILRTPAAKLSAEQKVLKARLKTGKALLVKEFGKSKQHQTIREILSGDARLWVELLSPVWLSTPVQVSKSFPMEENLFEWVIFDEASQVPLANALGSLQRSRHAVVAGDGQQMAPTSYFSGSQSGTDLLHQASYYWSKVPLKHHYRSEHPALISFSNRHFYDNELVAYASVHTAYPLHLHPVEKGVYNDRMNKVEASEIAAFLEKVSWKKRVGIVAFSEQQLECIRQACSPEIQGKIAAGQENGTVFFKALEQVQGDECDVLVISMGYGKNPEGQFQLRFGPLNQNQGHKRLNVLLTRAKAELHFFTSVKSADFAISANESVNLLRLFLQQLERPHEEKELELPYGIIPTGSSAGKLVVSSAWSAISSAQELITFHRVMSARGWKMVYK